MAKDNPQDRQALHCSCSRAVNRFKDIYKWERCTWTYSSSPPAVSLPFSVLASRVPNKITDHHSPPK